MNTNRREGYYTGRTSIIFYIDILLYYNILLEIYKNTSSNLNSAIEGDKKENHPKNANVYHKGSEKQTKCISDNGDIMARNLLFVIKVANSPRYHVCLDHQPRAQNYSLLFCLLNPLRKTRAATGGSYCCPSMVDKNSRPLPLSGSPNRGKEPAETIQRRHRSGRVPPIQPYPYFQRSHLVFLFSPPSFFDIYILCPFFTLFGC